PVLDNDSPGTSPIDSGSVSVIQAPLNGSVTLHPDGTMEYIPDTDFGGVDSFYYQICDTVGLCDTALVLITALPVPDTIPVTTPMDTPVEVCVDTTMLSGPMVSISSCEDSANGGVTYDAATGCIAYTPNTGFTGLDTTCVVICDANGICDTTIVTITVLPPPFECEVALAYLVQSNPSDLYEVNLATGESTLVAENLVGTGANPV